MPMTDSERQLIEDRYLPQVSHHIGNIPVAVVHFFDDQKDDYSAGLMRELRLSGKVYEDTMAKVHSNDDADMSDAEVATFEDTARGQISHLIMRIEPESVEKLRDHGYQAIAKEMGALIALTKEYDNAMRELENDSE